LGRRDVPDPTAGDRTCAVRELAAYARADTFGRFAALSPSVWWADRALVDFVEAGDQPQVRLWVDHGGAEPGQEQFRALRDALEADGFMEGADYHAEVVPGAGHTEGAWAARYDEVLRFLFPPAAP
jgi:enterochelin esterase-like enzyme